MFLSLNPLGTPQNVRCIICKMANKSFILISGQTMNFGLNFISNSIAKSNIIISRIGLINIDTFTVDYDSNTSTKFRIVIVRHYLLQCNCNMSL